MAGETVYGEYGIAGTLAGYTIESENITDTPLREPVPDQMNAVRNEIEYDSKSELKLTVRGTAKPSTDTIIYDGRTWKVDSVEKAGTYNGLRRWNITAHRYTNYPAAS